MDLLNDFAQKDMIEQITILDEIKEGSKAEAIPALLDLYANPLGDQAVDEMVYHTLFDLMADQERDIIAGFSHVSEDVQLLCVRRAADSGSDGVKAALVDLLAKKASHEHASEIIRALAVYKDPGLVDTLLPFLKHDDYAVVAWAMRVLAEIHDEKVRDALKEMITTSKEVQGAAAGCDLRTALAVENLASFNDAETTDFIIGYIHHSNPSFRRVVITSLASIGEGVLAPLTKCLESGDKDEKIMAANIIGMTGHKKGADLLVEMLESADDSNLKFAIYEALGRITSMKSIVGLNDGLAEQEELVLIAVTTSLDHLCNPGVVNALNNCVGKGDEQSKRVLGAIITSHARNLFAAMYKDGTHADTLIQSIKSSGDKEAVGAFRAELEKIEGDSVAADLEKLSLEDTGVSEKRILAADDSKAMLFFYKGVAADMGVDLVTVEDGKKAFDYMQIDSEFDLIITDMNMPNMDGIELTREIRKRDEWGSMPILMATTESEKTQSDIAREAGVNDFITKPFSKEDFRAKIEQMFS